ncbi:MAG: transcriptional regulator [Sphingobacteriales bacterium]|nr:transcriptional regulator [Sphingobacteriales bacterium]
MKNPINGLNKVFESRIRLGVMSILMVNEEINFNDLKQMLEVTDGNLATHLVNLEDNGFIKVKKGFIGRKTNTTYSITKAGEKAFNEHITALENMIKGVK